MKNIIKSLILALAAAALFAGCAQKEEATFDPYATNFVYLKGSNQVFKALFSTAGNWKSQPDTVVTLTQIRCTKPAPQDIKVTVKIDESMVEAYNAANGSDCKFFSNIELLQTQLEIKKGEYVSTDTLKMRITDFDAFLEGGTQTYVVPVKMTEASDGYLSESNCMYIVYDAAMLFGQVTGSYSGTKLDRSGWTVYVNEDNYTSTLTDGSKWSDVYMLFGTNTVTIDLGQVYSNLTCFGIEHYGASYGCRTMMFEISVDGADYKNLGTYDTYGLGSAVLEVFDPQEAQYVKITGYDPISSYYGWDIGEVNVATAN